MDLAEQLFLHMDDLACEGTRPVEVFFRMISWGEETIERKGLLFRIDVICACNKWWMARVPADDDRLNAAWRLLGNSITELLRNAKLEGTK